MKKIDINIPFDLLKEVEQRAKERNFTRSKLIREFLAAYLNELKKRELREKLKEGYLAHANRDQQISEEFVDSEKQSKLV
jgi:metal-responsive CopG/Arc/MetJ family transcriptional regulator